MSWELPAEAQREIFVRQPDFPVNYAFAEASRGCGYLTPAHWHEHIELLCVEAGALRVNIQGSWVTALPGELVVVNAGEIHSIPEKDAETLYACLIPQKPLCVRSGLPVEEIRLCHLIQDSDCAGIFRSLMQELRDKPLYYKADVQARLVSFLVQLARCHGMERRERSHHSRASKEYMVKRAVEYLQENFTQPISTGDVCAYLGFDKSYICNTFKEITGTTVLEYLNMMRCERARELILSGELSIAQSAAASGFRHWSYFTKTYKKYIGRLPSETARSGME